MTLNRRNVLMTEAVLAISMAFGLHDPCGSLKDNDPFINEKGMMSIEPRIIGGQAAGPTQFPYYAQWWGNPVETNDSIATCAATLIHSDILLTAAHCNGIVNNINVIVGAYYPYSSDQGEQRTVVKRAIHPDFNGVTIANDFLVLKLDNPVSTAPVTLNFDPASPYAHESLTIIGAGQTNETGQEAPTLMHVIVTYVDPATCTNNYRNVSTINSTVQLCAGVPGGGKGPCYGDSGGPVLTSKGVQVGVVSASAGCAEAGFPSINARVSGAVTWIRQQVCALSSAPPSYCPPNEMLTALILQSSSSTRAGASSTVLPYLMLALLAK